ncbi:hypothetical protein HanPSC8_Chr12g0522981 [Helianthus annuus]|nr:hypothetical protein HanPSC8_Chr12g0522981 [Helianthus annuus]
MLNDAIQQMSNEIPTAIGSKWLKPSVKDVTLIRKSLGSWLHKVAKYEVQERATLAPDTTYSKRMFPAAI